MLTVLQVDLFIVRHSLSPNVQSRILQLVTEPTSALNFDPRNILVIDFGQLGDVVLSLPALRAIRQRFPRARITVAAGKPASDIVRLSGFADDVLEVNRVALRDGWKVLSIARIFKFVGKVRKAKFDFVIDLHS